MNKFIIKCTNQLLTFNYFIKVFGLLIKDRLRQSYYFRRSTVKFSSFGMMISTSIISMSQIKTLAAPLKINGLITAEEINSK
mgnify:CR=1 FL=1